MDIGSFGKSSLAQAAISALLVRILMGVIPSVIGILSSIILGYQICYQSRSLNGASKAGI
jgi:hypothetical protein